MDDDQENLHHSGMSKRGRKRIVRRAEEIEPVDEEPSMSSDDEFVKEDPAAAAVARTKKKKQRDGEMAVAVKRRERVFLSDSDSEGGRDGGEGGPGTEEENVPLSSRKKNSATKFKNEKEKDDDDADQEEEEEEERDQEGEEDEDEDVPLSSRKKNTAIKTKKGKDDDDDDADQEEEEDEEQDQESEEEEEEFQVEEEEEEEEESEDDAPRYSRRARTTVDRYTPSRRQAKPRRRSNRLNSGGDDDDDDGRDLRSTKRVRYTYSSEEDEDGFESEDIDELLDDADLCRNGRSQKRRQKTYDLRDTRHHHHDHHHEHSRNGAPNAETDNNNDNNKKQQPQPQPKKQHRPRSRRIGAPFGDQLPLPTSIFPSQAATTWTTTALAAVGLLSPTKLKQQPQLAPSLPNSNNNQQPQSQQQQQNQEITPLEVDPTVSFEDIGGLNHYVTALKEMVFLPLVYPELFERFHVSPPRGVLFYGPPGTGKTLVARALAAHASRASGGRKISFFMRKGADVLSKWVGESERHLRLLFEEARRQQPSIIFFDEIDGLAPVRSSRSDQIHNSIVSTLLALMDGLDPRGQVVVIGATNRVDSVDGALRRPGRFDRELLFPLPNQRVRRDILDIHTRKWSEKPSPQLLEELASACVGYCGADLKALCTEASLAALRRCYPQIYRSEQKLAIDPTKIKVDKKDFYKALTSITPASHRGAVAPGRPLPAAVAPALQGHFQAALDQIQRIFPCASSVLHGQGDSTMSALSSSSRMFCIRRPRLLICGPPGCGQFHLGPALLYALEGLHCHSISMPSLLTNPSARSAEEALVLAFAEARRASPAILYLPHLHSWWGTASESLRTTLKVLLDDLPPEVPLLLLATADDGDEIALECDIFGTSSGSSSSSITTATASNSIYAVALPTYSQRTALFDRMLQGVNSSDGTEEQEEEQALEEEVLLPVVEIEKDDPTLPPPPPIDLQKEQQEAVMRTFRMALRYIMDKLFQMRRYEQFCEPVDPQEDALYYEVVLRPIDLSTILARVDAHAYTSVEQFLDDIGLIVAGERQYWGDLPAGVRHISRACALEDEVRGMVGSVIDGELRKKLADIAASASASDELLGVVDCDDGKSNDGNTNKSTEEDGSGGDVVNANDNNNSNNNNKEVMAMDVDDGSRKTTTQTKRDKKKQRLSVTVMTRIKDTTKIAEMLAERTGGLSLSALEELNARIVSEIIYQFHHQHEGAVVTVDGNAVVTAIMRVMDDFSSPITGNGGA